MHFKPFEAILDHVFFNKNFFFQGSPLWIFSKIFSPPAFTMRARAVSVKRVAQMRSLGTSNMRLSSVTVPTTTAIFPSLPAIELASLDKERGGRLRRDILSRLLMTLLNFESVRRAK